MSKPDSVRASGSVQTVRSKDAPRAIESEFKGFVDVGTVHDLNGQLRGIFATPPDFTCWFVDAVAVTGFSSKIVGPAGQALASFRSQGGRRLVLAAPLPSVRMIARALGLTAQVRIETCIDLVQARAALRRALAESGR